MTKFPFWDDDVTVTRVVGQRHFVVFSGSKKESQLSFCNVCGNVFTIRAAYDNRLIEICPGCGTEMMQGNG